MPKIPNTRPTEYNSDLLRLMLGDCRKVLASLEPDSFTACVTDPPYELGFMGKKWDSNGVAFQPETWSAVYRVMKPGAFLLAFGGTRTFHRLTCAIEDAGFEIRDCCMFLYGSGFPKSLDVSKAIDKALGAEREVIGQRKLTGTARKSTTHGGHGAGATNTADPRNYIETFQQITAPATPEAAEWQGYGTALKPAFEPLILAQKPLKTIPIPATLVMEVQNLLGANLCLSISSAKNAERLLASSRFALPRGSAVSALAIVSVLHRAVLSGRSEKTGMFNSLEMETTCLSIATLWSNISDVLLNPTSTFTTSMAIEVTTALKILKSFLSATTPDSIIQAALRPVGPKLNAKTAKRSSTGESWNNKDIPRLFAAEVATLHSIASGTSADSAATDSLPTIRNVNTVLTSVMQTLAGATSFSPAFEPIIVARKPLSEPNVAANVLKHGTGGINVDGCRIGTHGGTKRAEQTDYGPSGWRSGGGILSLEGKGRWPANVILDEEAAKLLDEASGVSRSSDTVNKYYTPSGSGCYQLNADKGPRKSDEVVAGYGDSGGASRFFYTAKASKRDRGADNAHPTVKPLSLMRYLLKLVKMPKHNLILDPFCGSGSTLVAAKKLGMNAVGVELERESFETAAKRTRLLVVHEEPPTPPPPVFGKSV